jgi:hypothetical protein
MGTANIAEALKPLATPIGDLSPLPGNPRKGDVEAVKRSYERFGQRKPIVALLDGTVIAGNHQLLAARALGWSEIAVVRVDDDETTAKAFSLADNRTSDLGGYDNDALAEMLSAIAHDTDLLFDTGYDEDFLAALLATVDIPTNAPESFDEINPDDMDTEYRCPSCNYEWSGSPTPGKPLHERDD